MAKFQVGDICIGQGFTEPEALSRNGMECTVLGFVPPGTVFLLSPWRTAELRGLGYKVEWADGRRDSVVEYCLRKKPPKNTELGSWDAIENITKGWNPTKALIS